MTLVGLPRQGPTTVSCHQPRSSKLVQMNHVAHRRSTGIDICIEDLHAQSVNG